ncbi:hypothetical protein BpHYR1_027271 [Brachionus plicatilis]|uniref:RNA-directed DNA polymerase from mobile element jockey-like n=1 Tax=Brachionus plicatilis TaxID=10195 RepID=A0A3M7RAV5_BRAPC|nr:hypothetical protein BpHYR1_027271 [Brachionus plicatilis]
MDNVLKKLSQMQKRYKPVVLINLKYGTGFSAPLDSSKLSRFFSSSNLTPIFSVDTYCSMHCKKNQQLLSQCGKVKPMNKLLKNIYEKIHPPNEIKMFTKFIRTLVICPILLILITDVAVIKTFHELISASVVRTISNYNIFNASKSASMLFEKKSTGLKTDFKLNGSTIPKVQSLIYLGLPIGNQKSINDFVENKMKKVEKSFYSLNSVGCKPKLMKPETIAFIYKQFSQSIFRYHLDNIFINEKSLKEFDIRQNILIKRFIGLTII